jgi:hypothetical protein
MGQRRRWYNGFVMAVLFLALVGVGAAGPVVAAPASAPQVRGGFAAFWAAHEGALLFGQPLTDEIATPGLTVQWFERARLEWHPDWPAGQQIALGRLGAEALAGTALPGVAAFPSNPDHRYFAQTGHSVEGEILRFWEAHGGVPIFGYPLSEERTEDGRTVQYFERARLEWHPELAGTGYGVLPAPLGALLAGPGAALAVVLEPPALQVGRTLLIRVPVPAGGSVTGTFAGHALAFTCCLDFTTPAGSLHTAWALAGVDPDLSLPPEPLTVRTAGAQGQASTASRTVTTVAYPYPVLRLPAYPYSQPRPSTSTSTDEHDMLRALVAARNGPPRWQGRWQPPLAGPLVVNSAFGERRAYGSEPVSVIHGGVDLDAQAGDPIYAPAPGRVVLAEPLATRGNVIVLDHGAGVYSLYAHQSAFRVRLGQTVQMGDVIGLVGSTGLATGPHLHWEVYVDDALVEPLQWLARSFP